MGRNVRHSRLCEAGHVGLCAAMCTWLVWLPRRSMALCAVSSGFAHIGRFPAGKSGCNGLSNIGAFAVEPIHVALGVMEAELQQDHWNFCLQANPVRLVVGVAVHKLWRAGEGGAVNL